MFYRFRRKLCIYLFVYLRFIYLYLCQTIFIIIILFPINIFSITISFEFHILFYIPTRILIPKQYHKYLCNFYTIVENTINNYTKVIYKDTKLYFFLNFFIWVFKMFNNYQFSLIGIFYNNYYCFYCECTEEISVKTVII